MVKGGNLECKRSDGVGEGQGQMPPMRKRGERISFIVKVPRNAEVEKGVSEHQTSAYKQGNSNLFSAKNGIEQRK